MKTDHLEELKPILRDLASLIRINSSLGTPEKGKPYGSGPYEALMWMLKRGEEYGCRTKNLDGYCGYIEIGAGEELVGILGHLDVVPEGEGWISNPFEMTIEDDDKIFGRGVLDDKGPVIVILHIMKELLHSEVPLNKRVRLILGTNEENVWDDIAYYKTHEEIPDITFTPDGEFPAIYAEKGILDISFRIPFNTEPGGVEISCLEGGLSRNSVADMCTLVLEGNSEDLDMIAEEILRISIPKTASISAKKENGLLRLTSTGKSVHCQHPEDGINAISQLMTVTERTIRNVNLSIPNVIKRYNRLIGNTYNGEKMGCNEVDEVSGALTFNVGKVRTEEREAVFEVSVRYPVTAQYHQIKEKLLMKARCEGVVLQEDDHVLPIYFDTNSELIKLFMDCYRSSTGDYESKPVMVGGGSYARTLPNCIAFGPAMPNAEEVAHQPNEYIRVSDIVKWKKIYGDALKKLLLMDLKEVENYDGKVL